MGSNENGWWSDRCQCQRCGWFPEAASDAVIPRGEGLLYLGKRGGGPRWGQGLHEGEGDGWIAAGYENGTIKVWDSGVSWRQNADFAHF